MSINKNDCMDCACVYCRPASGLYSPTWICTKKNIVLGHGNYLDVLDEDCPDFEYEE